MNMHRIVQKWKVQRIGHVAYINEVPFLVIRCISDSADDEAQASYDDFAKTAANYCSEIIVEMLKNISSKTYSSKRRE